MDRSWWRTGPPIKHRQPIPRVTGGQLLRQLLALALALLLYGGFFVFLGAASSSGAASVTEVLPTVTPSPAPTIIPTPTATHTPLPAATTTITATAEPTATTPPTTEPTSVTVTATPSVGDAAVSFQRDVQAIFDQRCVKCHGGDEVKEGLSLRNYAEVMQGSDNGSVIVPGDPANSLLVDMIQNGKMPKRGPRLLPRQIQAIIDWVTTGAPNN